MRRPSSIGATRGAWRASPSTSLAKRTRPAKQITPQVVAEEAEKGDEVARRVIMETAHWLAIGIVTFIHTIDPDAIVLGGAMTFGGDDRRSAGRFLATNSRRRSGRGSWSRFATRCGSSSPRSAATPATSARPGSHDWNTKKGQRTSALNMELDDELCLCFHVTKRKVVNYLRVERPQRESQLAECHGAGTGCGWCRPFLRKMFEAALADDPASADLPNAAEYASGRSFYVHAGKGTPPPGATPIEPGS